MIAAARSLHCLGHVPGSSAACLQLSHHDLCLVLLGSADDRRSIATTSGAAGGDLVYVCQ